MKPVRVLLADDHTLVRAGFRALFQSIEGIEVIAEAADGREALQMIATQQPDVVLMDIAMSGLNGLEATARVAQEFPHVHVVMLSMHANEEYVLQALRAGAWGTCSKMPVSPNWNWRSMRLCAVKPISVRLFPNMSLSMSSVLAVNPVRCNA